MNQPSVQDFLDEAGPDLSTEVEAILHSPDELTDGQANALWQALAPRFADTVEYGADFDMGAEVAAQIAAVRAMRRAVMTDTGVVRPGVPTRELKEIVTASNSLLTTLMKTHEKVLNYERQRAIEASTVKAIESLPGEAQEVFFSILEEELERIK